MRVGGSTLMPGDASGAAGSHPPVVEISHGKLRGEASDGILSFKGIPYGAPTGGINRFRAPQPVAKWAGVRDATKFGDQCPQPVYPGEAWFDSSEQSEDCLRLNVWTPEQPKSSGKLPVMVWIHGGGYTFESAGEPLYDGTNLALRGDVVVVSMNHRLNILGFCYLDTTDERFASASNVGILDLVEALRWVRDNVAAFGGDPANVTIFGESGGGGKVSALLGLPMARGLFHKAISQSGPMLDLRKPAFAAALTEKLYAKFDIKNGDIAALQQVPADLLAHSYWPIADEMLPIVHGPLAYGPTFDGVVFKEDCWRGGSPTSSHGIPMIIGNTLHEAIVWVGEDIHKPYPTDEAIAVQAVKTSQLFDVSIGSMAELVAISHKELPDLSPAERLVRVATETSFRGVAVHHSKLRAQSGGAPVFAYECRWCTPCFGGKWAIHAIDVPAVFGITHYGTAWDGTDSDALRMAADKDNLFAEVQQRMLEAWTAFAWTGNPSTPTLSWPAYDLATRATMIFDGASGVENDPRPLLTRAAAQLF
jgi:para-nitrobenzyl esterase